jgi:hypothetical protein
MLGGHVDGTPCRSREIYPRQCGAITAQCLVDDAATGLGNCPETHIRKFSEKGGFTPA